MWSGRRRLRPAAAARTNIADDGMGFGSLSSWQKTATQHTNFLRFRKIIIARLLVTWMTSEDGSVLTSNELRFQDSFFALLAIPSRTLRLKALVRIYLPVESSNLIAKLLTAKDAERPQRSRRRPRLEIRTLPRGHRFDYPEQVSENYQSSSSFLTLVLALVAWACGAAGSALPWHGRGRRFDPGQVHHIFNYLQIPHFSVW